MKKYADLYTYFYKFSYFYLFFFNFLKNDEKKKWVHFFFRYSILGVQEKGEVRLEQATK